MIIYIFIFVAGAALGSFLNVCIYRLPRGESLIYPSSHCVHCNHAIPWHDNIPFLGFLLLRGRCRFCARPIALRYIVVEFIMAGLLVLFYVLFGVDVRFFLYSILTSALVVSSFIDFEHQVIPDVITIPGIFAGLILCALFPSITDRPDRLGAFYYSIKGMLVGGGSIYLLGIIGELIFRKEAMGGGDVKLMAMIGAFLGLKLALFVFFVAPFFGAIAGVITKIRHNKNIIPYGPYLSIATLVAIIWGEKVLNYLLFY